MIRSGKATREQLRRHNRQLILRAIYTGLADSRAALAQETGLAKPTVSDVISELIAEGLIVEGGHGPVTDAGGKPPRLLEFVPDSRQVIGVSIKTDHVRGVLANLNGQVSAEHYAELGSAQGQDVIALLQQVINGLVAQLDAQLLCIGVGVSGNVNKEAGVVQHAPHFGWHNVPLARILSERYARPVYVASSTELAAMEQFMFGVPDTVQNLVTVLVNNRVGIGIVFEGGSYHNGSDIGCMQIIPWNPDPSIPQSAAGLEYLLGWSYIEQRAAVLRQRFPATRLPARELNYLHIRHAAANGDPAALLLQQELAGHLGYVFAWVVTLLRPDHVSLAGRIANLGEPLLTLAVARARELLHENAMEQVTFSLAESFNLVAVGAVAYTLQKELGLV